MKKCKLDRWCSEVFRILSFAFWVFGVLKNLPPLAHVASRSLFCLVFIFFSLFFVFVFVFIVFVVAVFFVYVRLVMFDLSPSISSLCCVVVLLVCPLPCFGVLFVSNV